MVHVLAVNMNMNVFDHLHLAVCPAMDTVVALLIRAPPPCFEGFSIRAALVRIKSNSRALFFSRQQSSFTCLISQSSSMHRFLLQPSDPRRNQLDPVRLSGEIEMDSIES